MSGVSFTIRPVASVRNRRFRAERKTRFQVGQLRRLRSPAQAGEHKPRQVSAARAARLWLPARVHQLASGSCQLPSKFCAALCNKRAAKTCDNQTCSNMQSWSLEIAGGDA